MGLEIIQFSKQKRANRVFAKNLRNLGVSTKKNHKELWLSSAVGSEILRHHEAPKFNLYRDTDTDKVYLVISETESIRFRKRSDRKNGGPWLRANYHLGAEFLCDHFKIEEESFTLELDVNVSPNPAEALRYEILKPQQ